MSQENLHEAYRLLGNLLSCCEFEMYEGRPGASRLDLMVEVKRFLGEHSPEHKHFKNKPPYLGESIVLEDGTEGTYLGVYGVLVRK